MSAGTCARCGGPLGASSSKGGPGCINCGAYGSERWKWNVHDLRPFPAAAALMYDLRAVGVRCRAERNVVTAWKTRRRSYYRASVVVRADTATVVSVIEELSHMYRRKN